MAAQIVAYEIFQARGIGGHVQPEPVVPLATAEQMQRLYEHLWQVMEEVDFRDRTQSGTNLIGSHPQIHAARRARPERGEHSARLSHVRAEPAAQGGRMSTGSPIYLDYAATTPVDPAVARAMSECLGDDGAFGNASSITHEFGRRAAARIEEARAKVAALIGADTDEIIFTSGATESNNLAILGAARANAHRGRHIVTVRTEHKAVLDPCKRLEKEGFDVSYLVPDRSGCHRAGEHSCRAPRTTPCSSPSCT